MPAHTWPEVLTALIRGEDLSSGQTAWAMSEILAGQASPAQIAGFAVALRAKGETIDELEGLVDGDVRARHPADASAAGCWTSSAPAATGRCR